MVKTLSLLPDGLPATLKLMGTFFPASLREEILGGHVGNGVQELGSWAGWKVKAEAMGNRGREMVERQYNWGTEERRLLQLYASLLGRTCAA